MSIPDNTKILRFELSTIIVGLALAQAVAEGVRHKSDLTTLLFTLFFFVNVINFYHAKLSIALEDRYTRLTRDFHYISLFESYLTMGLWLSLFVQSFFVSSPTAFFALVLVVRTIDIILIIFDSVVDKYVVRHPTAHKMQRRYWVLYSVLNIVFAAAYIAIYGSSTPSSQTLNIIAILLTISVFVDIFLDYLIGRSLYAPGSSPNGYSSADLTASGEDRDHIASELSEVVGAKGEAIRTSVCEMIEIDQGMKSFSGKKYMLDIGCGTGSTCRYFSDLGVVCVGVDISREMLRIAREYPYEFRGPKPDYLHLEQLGTLSNHFDFSVSLYAAQDTPDLPEHLRHARGHLRRDGKLYLLLETYQYLKQESSSASYSKIPLNDFVLPDLGERIRVQWRSGATITHARKIDDIIAHARASGFSIDDVQFLSYDLGFPKRVLMTLRTDSHA